MSILPALSKVGAGEGSNLETQSTNKTGMTKAENAVRPGCSP